MDSAEFRAGQKKQWNTAASGWRRQSERIDEQMGPVGDRLVELAGISPGSRVLDVACGYGEPSLTAARVAGPEGSVVGTDLAPEMLAYGRERAAAAGVKTIEFIESGAASLDFPEHSFDAAVSRFGIIFEPDGEGAAGKVRGFLKPGARMAIASWGPPERVPFLSIPMGTVLERLQLPPPAPGTPGPLSRPTPDALGGLLSGGGFSDVEVEELEIRFSLDSPEDFVGFVQDTAAPIVAMLAPHPQEIQDEVWGTVAERVAEAGGRSDGSVELSNLVLAAVGTA